MAIFLSRKDKEILNELRNSSTSVLASAKRSVSISKPMPNRLKRLQDAIIEFNEQFKL